MITRREGGNYLALTMIRREGRRELFSPEYVYEKGRGEGENYFALTMIRREGRWSAIIIINHIVTDSRVDKL